MALVTHPENGSLDHWIDEVIEYPTLHLSKNPTIHQ
jgi:hypothetical protein